MSLLHLALMASPMNSRYKCTHLHPQSTRAFLAAEQGRLQRTLSRIRERALNENTVWLPKVVIRTEAISDAGDIFRLSDATDRVNHRYSTVSEGGERFSLQISFQWDFTQFDVNRSHQAWFRHAQDYESRAWSRLKLLTDALAAWSSALFEQCKLKRPIDGNLRLLGLELRVSHLSEGRFKIWLEEQMR